MLWNPCLGIWIFIDIFEYEFLQNFDIIGRRLIGRYNETSVGLFPGLGIIMIFACFKGLGQYSSLRIAFSMYRRER
jgi:hypothetical protein